MSAYLWDSQCSGNASLVATHPSRKNNNAARVEHPLPYTISENAPATNRKTANGRMPKSKLVKQ